MNDPIERPVSPTRPVGKDGASKTNFGTHEGRAVQLVHSMATESLDPELFENLEEALISICANRGLDVSFK